MIRKLLLTVMFLAFHPIVAQQTLIQGRVVDSQNQSLGAANIYLEGTIEGAMTDDDGYFRFTTSHTGSLTLICSYLGYQTKSIALTLPEEGGVKLTISLRSQQIAGEMVMVTASSFSSGSEEGVTLTPLEVLTIPGAAADIFRAIQSFPGAQQVDEGAGLFVRGGDVAETAVILDGAYLKRPYRYESPTGGFFGTISPFLVKGTNFSSGGFSAQYGNALSGVLAMGSQDMPVRRQLTLGAGLAAWSGMLQLPIITEKLGVSFSGNYSDTRNLFELNNYQRDVTHFPTSYDFNSNGIWKYSQTGQLKLFLFRESNQTGIEVRRPGQSNIFEGDGVTELGNLQWKQTVGKKLLLTGNLAGSRFERQQKLGVLDLEIGESFDQARLTAEYSFTNSSLQSGISLFENITRYQGDIPLEEGGNQSYRIDERYRNRQINAFQELRGQLSKRWQYAIGWRGEQHSLADTSVLDPRYSLTFTATPQWKVVFSGGRYHQLPSLDYFDANYGNARLSPQRSWHSIAGVVFESDNYMMRIEGYYKNYSQLVRENSDRTFSSDGDGYSRGIDLFLKRDHPRYSGWISYSFLQSRRNWLTAPSLSPTRFDIPHQLTIVSKFDFSLRWHAALSYRFATGRPYTASATTFLDNRVPDYHTADVSLNYLKSFFTGNVTVFYLSVSNLFNRNNIFDYLYSPDFSRREPVISTIRRTVYFGFSFSM